jgi:hypothetical protein
MGEKVFGLGKRQLGSELAELVDFIILPSVVLENKDLCKRSITLTEVFIFKDCQCCSPISSKPFFS